MFCINCGANLPDEANFCLKCGKQQKQGVQTDETKWETCEINYKVAHDGLTGTRGCFRAEAIGFDGVYEAGRSQEFGCGYNMWLPDSKNEAHYNALIENLVKDRWEPTGERGEHWWNNRFRRKIVPKSSDEQNFVNLVILNAGSKKLETIKIIRSLTKFGFAEAKTLSETPNGVVLRNVSRSTALQAQSLFLNAGATVKIV
jgi:hypothetical protein